MHFLLKEGLAIKRFKSLIIAIVATAILFGFGIVTSAQNDHWPYSTNTYKYSQAEFEALAKTIDGEARGERMSGKVAVGNVILNRVFLYNSSIISIVTAANQFSYSKARIPTADSYEAARRVLDNEQWVVPQNTYYFKTSPPPSGSNTWSGNSSDPIKYWGKIDHHYFYVRKLDGRYNGTDVPAPMFYREYASPRLGIIPSDEVIAVQEMLVFIGYQIDSDGYFGDKTHNAVVDFQKKNNLYADGIVGEETLAILTATTDKAVLFIKPDELEQTPLEVNALLDKINRLKVIYQANPLYAHQQIALLRIKRLSALLRTEYNYSIAPMVVDDGKSHYAMQAAE